ncbi:MAG TPA: hypothetical protein VND19_23985 [Acetobacteraceae bacterium]|nr:hypothetical protein [Acetobacteraceae bacterium]
MLTETMLALSLAAVPPQTWPPSGLVAAFGESRTPDRLQALGTIAGASASMVNPSLVLLEGTRTIIGPAEVLTDRLEFARATAAQLMRYASLMDNWDKEGASAPIAGAIEDAMQMLEVTPPEAGPPKCMVLASGDVALYWDFEPVYAEIGFSGDGTYYAYAASPDVDPVHLDDVRLFDSQGHCVFPGSVRDVLLFFPTKAAA